MAIGLQWRAARAESIAIIGLQFVDSAVLAGQLFAVRRILDHLADEPGPAFGDFVPALLALTACYAGRAVLGAVVRERREIVGELVQRDVTLRVLESAVAVDAATFEDASFHDRLRRVRTQTYASVWNMVWALVNISTQVFVTVSMVVVLAAISPATLGVCLVGLVPFVWASRRRNRFNYTLSVEQTTRDRERTYLEDLLTQRRAAPELRSLALGDHLVGRMAALYDARLLDIREYARRRLRVGIAGGVVSSVMAAVALAVLLALAIEDGLGIAELGVAVLALQQLIGQLRGTAEVAAEIDAALPFLEDFRRFELDYRDARGLLSRPTEGRLPPLESLVIDDVSFTYPGTESEVLSSVGATITAGQVVALVGHNGSGKSTLAKLLAGLYEPTRGAIRWNGVDVRELDHAAVTASVGVVFQDFLRFELTVADNVGFGDVARLTEHERIREALRRAGAEPFVDAFAGGLETRLSRSYEAGAEPSGGQWQRLALARAFFRDAPLIVLDEPSAALDPEAERELFDDVRRLCADRTVVMISHRFSTVRNADQILVLDQGRLVEHGDHETLMAADGRYAALFRLQASPYIG